jgi:aryl-alcohol dehydrogenase-like predicted oxidoreductase
MTDHRPFGRTGLKVSPLTLGTMMFGAYGNPDHDDSIRIIHRALDAGINLVDTADVYSQGESETIVGKALAGGRRDDVVLATKFHGRLGEDVNQFGNSRRWIIREVEDSLRRLQTDWIDLYQVHRPEPDTDIDETLGALSDLVHAGKIRYIGTSTFQPSQIVEAQYVARERHRERPVAEQPPYSILARGVEREVLPVAQQHGLAVLPWSPLAGGWLSGRYRRGETQLPASTRAERQPGRHDPNLPQNARKLEAVLALTDLADQAGISVLHLALAFVLEHPAVTSAIIGPRTLEHLEAALGSEKIVLTPDILDRIDEIVAPGTTLNEADTGYVPPALSDPTQRRRTPARS